MEQPIKPYFVAVELTTKDGVIAHLWAASVDDPEQVFDQELVAPGADHYMEALDNMYRWLHEKGVDVKQVELVVWNKSKMLSIFARNHIDFSLDHSLDFVSFYAGMRGLSYQSASGELMNAEAGVTGIRRAQRLANLFRKLLFMSKHQQTFLQLAETISHTYDGIKSEVAAISEIS